MTEIAYPIDLNLATQLQDRSFRRRFFLAEASAWIAEQLIALRKRRGLSQKQVAELTNTQQPAISRVEQADYHNWSFNTLRAIADALDARIRVYVQPYEDVVKEYEGPGDVATENSVSLQPNFVEISTQTFANADHIISAPGGSAYYHTPLTSISVCSAPVYAVSPLSALTPYGIASANNVASYTYSPMANSEKLALLEENAHLKKLAADQADKIARLQIAAIRSKAWQQENAADSDMDANPMPPLRVQPQGYAI